MYPIWEGTTNILSLEFMKVISKTPSLVNQFVQRMRAIRTAAEKCGEVRHEIACLADSVAQWQTHLNSCGRDIIEHFARTLAFNTSFILIAHGLLHVWTSTKSDQDYSTLRFWVNRLSRELTGPPSTDEIKQKKVLGLDNMKGIGNLDSRGMMRAKL